MLYDNRILGSSLVDLLAYCGGKFSLITTCLIALQFISRIETLHEIGYLHRDLKPENFLIGINENSHLVYLIDFGLAKRYKNINSNGHHMAYKENKMLVGTARYASINSHLGIEISRRDDIESLVYILIYFFKGKLPWQHTSNREDREMKKIVEKKIKIAPEVLCEGLPKQFSNMLHYAKNLKFEDRPDYSLLKQIINEIFLTLVDYDKLDIFIPEYNDGNINSNDQPSKSPIKKNKKMKYSEFIYAIEHKKLNIEFNSNEVYTTNNSKDPLSFNIIYLLSSI